MIQTLTKNSILEAAKATITKEARAVAAQAEALDQNFLDLAQHLIDNQYKTFVAGIGKSGLVGRQLASKLACIGVKAVYIDPNDALHGELGLVETGDLVICLSKSGATGELVFLAKVARLRGAKIAAIVCRVPSPLSKLADWTINLDITEEATEIEIPTSSAIATTAVGDALVVAVANARGFTASQFSENHPAGNLGVLLGSQINDLMHKAPEEVPVLSPESFLHEALIEMTRQPLGAALVADSDNRLIGIITDGDIRRIVKDNPEHFLSSTVGNCMTKSPLFCQPDISAIEVLKMMEENKKKPVYVVPVVDINHQVLGLVRMHDLTQFQLKEVK